MARRKTKNPHPVIVLALGWLIPGAGHVCIGRAWRGIIIFLAIGATFWAGVAVGGVLTVDPATQRWWSYSEMCAGVHGLIGWYRQKALYEGLELPELQAFLNARQTHEQRQHDIDTALTDKGVALVYPTNVVARAYAGIAGLLNLLCVFDATALAMMGVRGEPRRLTDTTEAPQ